MAKFIGIKALNAKLEKRIAPYVGKQTISVIVGYTASYAINVHERVEMKWRGKPRHNGNGRYWDPLATAGAKFLERPARLLHKELAEIIRTAFDRGVDLQQCLYLAGLNLQRASQKLVPVDTSNLKGSAFTRKE